MMTNVTSNPGVDPNLGRVLEETVTAVRELDQRLQFLKIGISQAFPHLAHALEGDRRDQWANGLLGQLPTAGLTGIPQQQTPGFGRVGVNPFTGQPLNVPLGYGLPQQIPGAGIGQAFGPAVGQGFAQTTIPQGQTTGNVGMIGQQVPGQQAGLGVTGGIGNFRGFL